MERWIGGLTYRYVECITLLYNMVESWVYHVDTPLEDVNAKTLPRRFRTANFFDNQWYEIFREDSTYVSRERTHSGAGILHGFARDVGSIFQFNTDLY